MLVRSFVTVNGLLVPKCQSHFELPPPSEVDSRFEREHVPWGGSGRGGQVLAERALTKGGVLVFSIDDSAGEFQGHHLRTYKERTLHGHQSINTRHTTRMGSSCSEYGFTEY